jgi:hypothetical protein
MPGQIRKRFQSQRDDRGFQNEMMTNGGNHAPSNQPSRWDSFTCASIPALKRWAIIRLPLWGGDGLGTYRVSRPNWLKEKVFPFAVARLPVQFTAHVARIRLETVHAGDPAEH